MDKRHLEGDQMVRFKTAFVICLIGAAIFAGSVLRGCMTEHSRPVGHNDITFNISPDGNLIVFAGVGHGGRDLYLFDLRSHRVTSLTSTDDYEICPSFSPDGKSVAFTRGTPGVRADQLCVMDLSTRKVQQITDADENVSSPVFLPDGKRVVCTVETEYRWGGLASSWKEGGELRIIDIQTGKQVSLKTPTVPVFRPRVSADGEWVAWIGDGVYLGPVANTLQASNIITQAHSVAVNKDGTKIAASLGEYSTDLKIYLTDRTARTRQLISGEVGGCSNPIFSPDGKWVYFLVERWLTGPTDIPTKSLMRANIDGSHILEVAPYKLFESPLTYKP